ncbi:hypothetical protein GGS24DRAFT_462892 [Hypoxylon argillaceum]|nr:hypothetical protein GGS24DRAFT_462892 [Hypoxylon argillaceum]
MEDLNVQEPRPRGPRLYHKKSRTGCLRCKQRRVKVRWCSGPLLTYPIMICVLYLLYMVHNRRRKGTVANMNPAAV